MPSTSASSAHDTLAGYTIGNGVASGTDVLVAPFPAAVNPVATLNITVPTQDVDVNVVYGNLDTTLFANLSPGQSLSLPRVAFPTDTTTVSRSADGLVVTFDSTNAGTGFDPTTTITAS